MFELTATEIKAYLEYIKIDPEYIRPDYEFLCRLQLQHIQYIPWENMNPVFIKDKTPLDPSVILRKILKDHRGGICYELNHLYYILLKSLGFKVHLVLCLVYGVQHIVCDKLNFTHITNLIEIDSKLYVTDVGWDGFRKPLPLDGMGIRTRSGHHRISATDKGTYLLELEYEGAWRHQYEFVNQAIDLNHFEPYMNYEDVDWIVANMPCCFTYTETGSLCLSKDKLTISEGEKNISSHVSEHGGLVAVLKNFFGISESALDKILNSERYHDWCEALKETV